MNIRSYFGGIEKQNGALSTHKRAYAVNLTPEQLRLQASIMSERAAQKNENRDFKLDFQAAMDSLASANMDIDRLNRENAKLLSEIECLRTQLQHSHNGERFLPDSNTADPDVKTIVRRVRRSKPKKTESSSD